MPYRLLLEVFHFFSFLFFFFEILDLLRASFNKHVTSQKTIAYFCVLCLSSIRLDVLRQMKLHRVLLLRTWSSKYLSLLTSTWRNEMFVELRTLITKVLFSYTWSTVSLNVCLCKPQVITPRQLQFIALEVMQQIHLLNFLYPFQLHSSCECHCHLRR